MVLGSLSAVVDLSEAGEEGGGCLRMYEMLRLWRTCNGFPEASRCKTNRLKSTKPERANTALREPKTMSELLMMRLFECREVQHPY